MTLASVNCRFCDSPLSHSFCDLGMSPLANSYLSESQLNQMEPFYPLHAYVCSECFLVQLQEFETAQNIFSNYAYFSSYSDTWLKQCEQYASTVIDRFGLNQDSFIVEIASNDGYLLQYFKSKKINVLGIEPAENVAQVAINSGIDTRVGFFDKAMASALVSEQRKADLVIANNVLAHVPNINSFVSGFKLLLEPEGVATIEFPHLLNLINQVQFDTIYHEHFSYFSLFTAKKIFNKHGLEVFDVEELPTHGGSLRVYLKHMGNEKFPVTASVGALLDSEKNLGVDSLDTYAKYMGQVANVKNGLLKFLISAHEDRKSVVGYGAAAKGNTLLNYCGIKTDYIDFVVDKNPEKQNKYLPGSHIPVFDVAKIEEAKPDYVLILPWNLSEEISREMSFIDSWGGKCVIAIPRLEIFS